MFREADVPPPAVNYSGTKIHVFTLHILHGQQTHQQICWRVLLLGLATTYMYKYSIIYNYNYYDMHNYSHRPTVQKWTWEENDKFIHHISD